MIPSFKVGDKVICVHPDDFRALTGHKEYVIVGVDEPEKQVIVRADTGHLDLFMAWRFEKLLTYNKMYKGPTRATAP